MTPKITNIKFIIQTGTRFIEVNFDYEENEITVHNDDKEMLKKWRYPTGLWKNPDEDSAYYYGLTAIGE